MKSIPYPSRSVSRVAGFLIFALGVAIGLLYFGGATWADIEAFLFDSSFSADKPLTTLNCPVIIGPSETGVLKATFTNPSDTTFRPRIRARFTAGLVSLIREEENRLSLEPGESQQLEWQVTGEDAVWGNFILARIYQFRQYPQLSRTATCGILVVDFLGLGGRWLTALAVVISLLGMLVGLNLWVAGNRPLSGRIQTTTQAMVALAAVVFLGMAGSLTGLWMLSAAMVLVGVLLSFMIIAFLIAA
ncbi:MAG: hypothetical protein AB1894_03720 [Chloroflexota bacterium]